MVLQVAQVSRYTSVYISIILFSTKPLSATTHNSTWSQHRTDDPKYTDHFQPNDSQQTPHSMARAFDRNAQYSLLSKRGPSAGAKWIYQFWVLTCWTVVTPYGNRSMSGASGIVRAAPHGSSGSGAFLTIITAHFVNAPQQSIVSMKPHPSGCWPIAHSRSW